MDLSNPIRLSGLSSGAKLELVLISRSPSVVSVALQLPESEAHGLPAGRLVEKYPSNTTIWMILRNFEHTAPHRNYTQRGKAKPDNDQGGAGRLYHEAPVLSIMGRELTSFTDLQKTLAQLGFNSGSVLLRLGFRVSNTTLEEAMEQIQQYFKSVQSNQNAGAHATSMTKSETVDHTVAPIVAEEDSAAKSPPEPGTPVHESMSPSDIPGEQQEANRHTLDEPVPLTVTGPGQRPVTVYKPPSSSTPRAAQQAFDEADYEPTIRHAKQHQARLQGVGRNKTLPSDRELAEKENAKAEKLAEIREVEIRIRFPDQSMVNQTFSNLDTARSLYDFARECLRNDKEPFLLSFTSVKGPRTIPANGTERLVSDLGMLGKTLVNLRWDEGASIETRTKPSLKEYLQAQAREVEIPHIPDIDASEEPPKDPNLVQRSTAGQGGTKSGKPKWLNKLIKK